MADAVTKKRLQELKEDYERLQEAAELTLELGRRIHNSLEVLAGQIAARPTRAEVLAMIAHPEDYDIHPN